MASNKNINSGRLESDWPIVGHKANGDEINELVNAFKEENLEIDTLIREGLDIGADLKLMEEAREKFGEATKLACQAVRLIYSTT